MTLIDDNYLDSVITRLTREHKDILMRTAKRLNLPDDDVLFLYIGAIEYTVQLCEDILGGIRTERQSIEQSAEEVHAVGKEQARAIIRDMVEAATVVIAKFTESGSAATSAIAEANGEVLNQSKATVREAIELLDLLKALIANVKQDRETNINVLEVLLKRVGQTTAGLDKAIKQVNDSHTAIKKLQQGTTWVKIADWFSPLFALLVASIVSFGAGLWVMGLKYNESGNILGRNLVQWNIERIVKCQQDNNPKCTIWIVTPPEQRK